MTKPVKANISLLHIAGGEGRSSPPPGTLALSPPRKAARGRSHDFLFVSLKLLGNAGEGRASRLAQVGAQAFFRTPGSVTAALRQATLAVNQVLLDGALEASMVVGALRGQDLYFSECGAGATILIRSGTVSRMNGSKRPLGSSLAPMIQFQHLELQPSDLIILTAADDVPWSDVSLTGLASLGLEQVSDRLVAGADRDITGLVIQVPGKPSARSAAGESRPGATVSAAAQVQKQPAGPSYPSHPSPAVQARPASVSTPGSQAVEHEPAGGHSPDQPPAIGVVGSGPRSKVQDTKTPKDDPADFENDTPRIWARQLAFRLRIITRRASRLMIEVIVRLIPGTLDPQKFDEFSPNLLAFTAAAVPILVVGISSLIYFKQGRVEQFDSYLAQAQSSVIAAQLKPPGEESRPDWVTASQWLDLAESYQTTDGSISLRSEVQAAMDGLDRVVRLNFVPAVSGGFGPKAELVSVAATATDLYAYDRGTMTIWHAWATGRGYEIDNQFQCLAGADSIPDFGQPVGMVIQREPGALGTEGVVAIDANASLLYCAPGADPLTGQLAAPDVGWGRIQAIEVFGDDLYVLDPVRNAVWIYDAADGLFSGSPALYFVEEVRELGTAIDLALAQDELIILYADGGIDRCRREVESTVEGNVRIRVECESKPQFQDERAGFGPQATILGAEPISSVYSPPPEPSLFFLDGMEGTVFHYSMRLVYQAQYPTTFEAEVTAITAAPPNDLFVAAGDQIYFAQLGR
ncbi:MAG: hypothetical protein ACC647_06425 [Anaerolineales bacterium]